MLSYLRAGRAAHLEAVRQSQIFQGTVASLRCTPPAKALAFFRHRAVVHRHFTRFTDEQIESTMLPRKPECECRISYHAPTAAASLCRQRSSAIAGNPAEDARRAAS